MFDKGGDRVAKRVLLKDIALKSGLTINSVSRALKDKSDIAIETRKYVQQLAIEMGYIPDVVASSLRSGSTRTIGVMYDNIANPYYIIMTELIHRRLKEAGFEIMIYSSTGDHAQFDVDSFNIMVSRRLDGIISFLRPTEEVVRLSKANNIPIVVCGREGDDLGIDAVYTNDVSGGYQMGRYLLGKGLKKIGYIGAPKDILCSLKRAEGLIKAYEEQQIPFDPSMIRFIDHYDASFESHIDALITMQVDALFCFNDSMAFEAITYINSKNINHPIEVTGYDNISARLKIPVKLVSVDTIKDQMVNEVIFALLQRIENPNASLYTKVYDVFLV